MARFQALSTTRLLIGFVAGFFSVLVFINGLIAILYAASAVPSAPWNLMAAPPLGVPQVLSDAFWGGLWGVVYALLEPKLTARLGRWPGGAAFGWVPVLVSWFVVAPIKGMPVADGFVPSMMLLRVVFGSVFGLGIAIIFRFGRDAVGNWQDRAAASG